MSHNNNDIGGGIVMLWCCALCREGAGLHTHDSLLGLGWLLRLLIVRNDKANSRVWLLEERSQFDLNLLGPERRDVRGTRRPREHMGLKKSETNITKAHFTVAAGRTPV